MQNGKPDPWIIDVINKNLLFFNAAPDTVGWLLTQPELLMCRFDAGSTVYDPHSFQRCLGILLRGRLEVSKPTQRDKRVVMSHLMPGQLFGAAALFHDHGEYVTHIQARLHSQVLMIPQELLLQMLQRDPQVMENYLQYLSTRIYFLNQKIDALAQDTAQGRLAQHLMTCAGQSTQQHPIVVLPYPMAELAQVLGISRASLYRAVQLLEQQGLIKRQGKEIKILNMQALRLL